MFGDDVRIPSRVAAVFASAGMLGGVILADQGAAVVSGTVLTDDAARRPVRAAVVTARSSASPIPRSAITDDAGQFTIRDVAPGRVTIEAARPGFLTTAAGATRPGRPGTPVVLVDGQHLTLALTLSRGAVLTGVIRDGSGEPVPGLMVFAIDARRGPSDQIPSLTFSQRQGRSEQLGTTDDRGVYRLFGLRPGEYVVTAFSTSESRTFTSRTSEEVDAIFARLRARGTMVSTAPRHPRSTPARATIRRRRACGWRPAKSAPDSTSR
jgi:protocatechuate 3,4-dioxygenase beta subunit